MSSTRSLWIKLAFMACVLPALVACGNPFAGKNEKTKTLNSFHSTTPQCNQINLASESLDEKQLRAIIGCLNSNHEIEAVEQVAKGLTSKEFTQVVTATNALILNNAERLYATKEMYLKLKADGRLKSISSLLGLILADPERNRKASAALRTLSPILRSLIESGSFSLAFESLYSISLSPSYQRWVSEHNQSDTILLIARSLNQYLNQTDATSIERLYTILSTDSVARAFKGIASDKNAAERLASFFDWVFTENRFETLSTSISEIQNRKLRCFNNQVEIHLPLNTALETLSKLNPNEAKRYLNHDLKNLLLTSRGYCELPYSLEKLFRFLDEASKQPGFDQIYTLLRPLMNDERFINFLSSNAARVFVKGSQFLTEKYFFQDLITLVAEVQSAALSTQGRALSQFLDQVLRKLKPEQVEVLLAFLRPIFSKEELYGATSFKILASISEEFPIVKSSNEGIRGALAPAIETLLSQEKLDSILNLTYQLNRDGKLIPLIDQSIKIFERYINRGRSILDYGGRLSAKPASDKQTSSFSWLLAKIAAEPKMNVLFDCNTVTDWDFSNYSDSDQSGYLKNLELIGQCLNPNPTFFALKALASDLISSNRYASVLNVQKSFFSEAFTLDTTLPLETIQSFLALPQHKVQNLRTLLQSSSTLTRYLANPLLLKPQLNQFVSKQSNQATLYKVASRYLDSPDAQKPPLKEVRFTTIDTQVVKDQILRNQTWDSALDKLFTEYCPSLSIDDATCDIDEDQVKLYLQSKSILAKSIQKEFLSSSQSWMHPNQFSAWGHPLSAPTQVSDLDYHINPLLNLVRTRPEASRSVFTAVKSIANHGFDLERFLRERANRITLIPYIYQVTQYPAASSREFHQRIRLRLVSDLDRLELLAINADFRALGLVQNLGMGFIREIGLSWGDVPSSQWPERLKEYKPLAQVRTLAETTEYIHAEMGRFDRGIIHRLGECDPRGRNAVGRWFQRRFCTDELSDISARLFNLRFLIPLLDRELEDAKSQSGGLALLRDLFFSLYDSNSVEQYDVYTNGVSVGQTCLAKASSSVGVRSECATDVLNIVPRITRLGVLHQIGLNFLQNDLPLAPPLLNALNLIAADSKTSKELSELISSQSGAVLSESAVDFGFRSGSQISDSLVGILPLIGMIKNTQWVSGIVSIGRRYPELLSDHSPLLIALLSGNGHPARKFVATLQSLPNSESEAWLLGLSRDFSSELGDELASSFKSLKPKSEMIATEINRFRKLPSFNSDEGTEKIARWLDLLSSPKNGSTRLKISEFLSGENLKTFCAVYSDANTVDLAYKFLDQLHQNSDSSLYFDACQDFLKRK